MKADIYTWGLCLIDPAMPWSLNSPKEWSLDTVTQRGKPTVALAVGVRIQMHVGGDSSLYCRKALLGYF